MTGNEVRARTEKLRMRHAPRRTARETLDQPIDPDVQVTGGFPRYKLSLVLDGEARSSLAVTAFEQQIGSATVRMGGVGSVGTHKEHRFQGYMRRVMESALRWMRREDFDTTALYGIPSFYPKFGYAQAFPGVQFTMAVRDAEALKPHGYRLVKFAPAHLRAVLRMYHANNVGRTGPTLRDPKHWEPFRKGVRYDMDAIPKVALDANGRPVGYVVLDSEHLTATVIEVGFATQAVFPDVLHAAALRAVRQRLERLTLILPEDDAFVEWCKPLGLRKEVTWRPDAGAMVRLISIPSALRKVASELGSRMRGSGSLTIRTNLDDAGLAWSKGRLRVGPPQTTGPKARLPQWALAQLLYGYRSAEAMAVDGTLRATRRALAALGEMFPVRPHFHHLVDHF